jgi:hypothetical protein
MSRMIADNDDDLLAVADLIGLDRQHFQHTPSGDHYDISKGKRVAIEAGAVEITIQEPESEVGKIYQEVACVSRFSMTAIIESFAKPMAIMASAS